MKPRTIFKWSGNKSLEEEKMKINGKIVLARRIRTNDAVVVLPILENERVILERQFRKGVKKWVYEIPAGRLENGEKPKDAARRELQEEIGYSPRKLELLFKSYINPGLETELDYFFLGTDLIKSKKPADVDEQIQVKILKLSQVEKMIERNEILDHTALVGLLYYLKRLSDQRK